MRRAQARSRQQRLKHCYSHLLIERRLWPALERITFPLSGDPLSGIYVFVLPSAFLLLTFQSAVPIILFALVLFVLLAFGGVILLSIALRYRAGTARRQARRWVASLNLWATSFSAVFFLSFTLLLSFWVGSAFRFALIGLSCGAILGLLGLAMTHWERRPEGLFYTPNRWLAVLVTLAIAARFIYGWWRAMHSGSSAAGNQHWLITASGTQFSLAVAAGLIGYYLAYSIGVRLRLARHERRQFI